VANVSVESDVQPVGVSICSYYIYYVCLSPRLHHRVVFYIALSECVHVSDPSVFPLHLECVFSLCVCVCVCV